MIVEWSPLSDSYPDITRVSPRISEADRLILLQKKPPAIAAHCKPWIDAESYGLVVPYPYDVSLRILGLQDGNVKIVVNDGLSLTGEQEPPPVSAFAPGHWSIKAGYRFLTDRPIGLLTRRHRDQRAVAVEGIIETWWYSRPPFIVFQNPGFGECFSFHKGDPLCLLLPVIADTWTIGKMPLLQVQNQERKAERYTDESQARDDILWESDRGQWFSRLYKEVSRKMRGRIGKR